MMRQSAIWIIGLFLVLALPLGLDLTLRGVRRLPHDPVFTVPGGDAERGRQSVVQYGCGSCHVIPGVRVATGRVGPRLEDLRAQIYIAGVLSNTPENLVRWIQAPRDINPRTAMPNLDVSESEARDIAAYLYSFPRRPWTRPRTRPETLIPEPPLTPDLP